MLTDQGHFVDTHSEPSSMGFRRFSGSRWTCFHASFQGDEKRFCEWNFPLCCYGFSKVMGSKCRTVMTKLHIRDLCPFVDFMFAHRIDI